MTAAPPDTCEACGGAMRRSGWVRHCPECGFLASTLEPGAGADVEGLEDLRRRNFGVLLDRLQADGLTAGADVLEVGCADGAFLALAAARGLKARGIEPEAAAAEAARKKGLDVATGFFPADVAAGETFDLIVFNDVFEHIPRPSAAIRDVEALLRPGGRVAINLPSSDGALFRIASLLDRLGMRGPYERLWQKGLASPHVSYFNPANLCLLAERHSGLRLRDGFPLATVTRAGLHARIRGSHGGPAGLCLFVGVWVLSFILPILPADIAVAVFEKESG